MFEIKARNGKLVGTFPDISTEVALDTRARLDTLLDTHRSYLTADEQETATRLRDNLADYEGYLHAKRRLDSRVRSIREELDDVEARTDVALTRAKERLDIQTRANWQSPFLDPLEAHVQHEHVPVDCTADRLSVTGTVDRSRESATVKQVGTLEIDGYEMGYMIPGSATDVSPLRAGQAYRIENAEVGEYDGYPQLQIDEDAGGKRPLTVSRVKFPWKSEPCLSRRFRAGRCCSVTAPGEDRCQLRRNPLVYGQVYRQV